MSKPLSQINCSNPTCSQIDRERIKNLQNRHSDLSQQSLQQLQAFKCKTAHMTEYFTKLANMTIPVLDDYKRSYSRQVFRFRGSAQKIEDKLRSNFQSTLLGNTIDHAEEAIVHASTTIESLKKVQLQLNEIVHLGRPRVRNGELGKLRQKWYWKRVLLDFKYEDEMGGFTDAIAQLAEYFITIENTIAIVSEVRETSNSLVGELHQFKTDLEDIPPLSREKGGPTASLQFYRLYKSWRIMGKQ